MQRRINAVVNEDENEDELKVERSVVDKKKSTGSLTSNTLVATAEVNNQRSEQIFDDDGIFVDVQNEQGCEEDRISVELSRQSDPNDNENTPQPNRKRKRNIAMLSRYSDAILAIITEEQSIKRAVVFERLTTRLGIDVDDAPVDFPIEKQVKTKFSNFKRMLNQKKKK